MPTIHPPVALIALRLGAGPRDLLDGALAFVLDRADLVADDDLLTVLRAVSRADPAHLGDLARELPDALGELVDRAITASDLPRPLALARVKAGLFVGPGDDRPDVLTPNTNALGTPQGLVLPPAVRARLAVRLVTVEATLAVSEGGRPFVEVPARTAGEFWALYPNAEMPPRAQAVEIADELFGPWEEGDLADLASDAAGPPS